MKKKENKARLDEENSSPVSNNEDTCENVEAPVSAENAQTEAENEKAEEIAEGASEDASPTKDIAEVPAEEIAEEIAEEASEDIFPTEDIAEEIAEEVSEDIFPAEDTIPFAEAEITDGNIEEENEEATAESEPDTDTVADTAPVAEEKKPMAPVQELPDANSHKPTKAETKKKVIESAFDFVELFIFTLVSVLLVTSFFFRHSIVSGPSMMNSLYDGQTLIISDFMYEPKAGDIVVCQDYTMEQTLDNPENPIVKRIIATEGQTVYITKNEVYVDAVPFEEGSVPLVEEYVYTSYPNYNYFMNTPIAMEKHITPDGIYYSLYVPEGEVFVMGDHRNNSTDSRVLGTVSEDAILGRVLLRIFPFAEFGRVK